MKQMSFIIVILTLMLGMFSLAWAAEITVGPSGCDYTTIQAAIDAAQDGDIIEVAPGTYQGNVIINKNITLLSTGGAAVTIIEGDNSGPELGTIHLNPGRDGVRIGAYNELTGHDNGFTVLGFDSQYAPVERSAIYIQGNGHTNLIFEGNIIEARGETGLTSEYNATISNVVINRNQFTGKTFVGDNPAGVGFAGYKTLYNVPRQLVVFGGSSGTTNTHSITFTNNIISGTTGGMSISDNNGNSIDPTPQGNTLVTLDLAGDNNVITGNIFSGFTTSTAEALRVRGPGTYTITGNTFNGIYNNNISAATSSAAIGSARIAAAFANNTFTKSALILNSSEVVKVNAIPTLINASIYLAENGDVVKVGPGTYAEDLRVNKSIRLTGADATTTIIEGVVDEHKIAVFIEANNVIFEDFTVTRTGNNVTEWSNNQLNENGVIIQQNVTGCTIQNCIFTGNRNAIYLNNTRNHVIQNNVIDFNRTGLQLVNNCSNVVVKNNQITNNWTLGILFYYNSDNQSASTGVLINNNNISGNWYSQIECKTIGSNPSVQYDCTKNWLGSAIPQAVTTIAGEPGYYDLIPVQYGGTYQNPGTSEGMITGQESGKIKYDPWWRDEEMTLPGSSEKYVPGQSYSFTVHSPNSEDGAKAVIWGFYIPGWTTGTFGIGYFQDHYATVEYTVPNNYSFGQEFYWEVYATQKPNYDSKSTLYNKTGPWDQFDTYMLNGQTLEIDAYRFEDLKVDINSASVKMITANDVFHPGGITGGVKVYIPWSGDIEDYNNDLYNNTILYDKKGFYPSYAQLKGFDFEVVAQNSASPDFQKIRISKPEIGYEVTLFGYKCASSTEPDGFMWWTTFYKASVASMTMQYDSSTGILSGQYDEPLEYYTQYFIQPEAEISVNDSPNMFYVYTPGGGTDFILNAGVFTPIQNTRTGIFYNTIQAAIDEAEAGDEITVAAGEYDQTMNFVGKSGITITGAGEENTIFKPTTAVNWDYFGYTSGRRAAIRIVESDNITINGITLDCYEIKNNGWFGVMSGNSTAVYLQNSTFKNMYTDRAHYNDVMIYANAEGSTYADATLNVEYCKLIDTGRLGVLTHYNVHAVIHHSVFYKTTHSFGYGIEIGRTSSAVIHNNELYGFDTPAASDNSTSGAIYIENCFTQAITEATEKVVTIEDNNIYNCQSGITIGNQHVDKAGNVDIIANVTGNTLTNNAEYGIMATDEGKSNGSSVTAILTGNNISSNLEADGSVGIWVYAIGNGDLNVRLIDNEVSGYDIGHIVHDYGNSDSSSYVTYATGNTFKNADYGVYTGNVNWADVSRQDNPHFSGNFFESNVIHVANAGDDIDMDFIETNNTFDGAYKYEQIIYGTNAAALYVDAEWGLIKDEEEQVYSVKMISVENLRGYEMKVRIPKEFFEQPTDFAIGSAYSSYNPVFFQTDLVTDNDYWIYNIGGSFLGVFEGITGADKELFSFKAKSKLDVNNTPDGCLIEVPYDTIVLTEVNDGHYSLIECLASIAFQVIIDCVEPAMLHNNADVYPSGYLLHVMGDGSGLIDRPELILTFSDNYDLNNAKYLIQPETADAPVAIVDFSLAMFDIDGLDETADWQLPESVDALYDGTYTVYFLVVDDAGNFSIYDWDFIKDATPPEAITWHASTPCRITPRWDNKIDLNWANGAGTVKNHIWIKSYASLPEASGYPLYAPAGDYTMPAAPNPYINEAQNGWTRAEIVDPPATMPYTLDIDERGYYYITLFAEDASGNISAAPADTYYREALSYWLGDVTGTADGSAQTVNAADIAAMSPHWFTSSTAEGWDNIIDVGPTVGNYRSGRPMPDGRINIEDLMVYSMNYNNTVYTYYREDEDIQIEPIRIEMQYAIYGDELNVDLYLYENQGYLRGLNIPVQYGSGLSFVSQEAGSIWPEESILLHKDENGIFTLSGSALGAEGVISDNGLISRLTFRVNGSNTDLHLCTMIARDIDNGEIEIINNPTGPSDTDDPVNVIPAVSYMNDNYPNPFNPSTTIRFGLHQGGMVNLKVYNARGQLVRTLHSGEMQAGNHQLVWNGVDSYNRPVSSGVYFIRMETKDFVSTKKALMMK